MLRFIYLSWLFASSLFAISNEEATKMVDKYDTLQKKILGFINCVSNSLTGEEAITPMEPTAEDTQRAQGLGACFKIVGFKMGGGFTKLTKGISNGDLETNAEEPREPASKPAPPAQDLIKNRVPASQPAKPQAAVPPPASKVEKPVEKIPPPAAKPKIKTAW